MMSPGGSARYVRFSSGDAVSYGAQDGGRIREIKSLFDDRTPTGREYSLHEVKILVPCEPSKVIAIGLNYKSHRQHVERAEGVFVTAAGRPVDGDRPVIFAKFPTSLIPDGQEIVFPADATNVHFEGELALVIGKKAKNISVDEAANHVFGVTICNDLVDREWLLSDLQWFRAKGADGFGPVGPAIVTGLDYNNLGLKTRVNGELRQSANTSELIFSPDEILSYCSRYVTLLPGDIIFTGTPGKTERITWGDTIEIEIEGVGTLTNKVAQQSATLPRSVDL